jgi:hypothetical protein
MAYYSFFGTASRSDRSPSVLNQSVIIGPACLTWALGMRQPKQAAAFQGPLVKGDGYR